MEEAFFDTPLYREFAQLQEFGRHPSIQAPAGDTQAGRENPADDGTQQINRISSMSAPANRADTLKGHETAEMSSKNAAISGPCA